MNKSGVSVMLKVENINFAKNTSKLENVSMSSIIDSALDIYRKYKLKKELMEEAAMETEEDIKEAMSDFGDYQNIIDNYN